VLSFASGNKYKLTDWLGQGTYGQFYKATGLQTGEVVVVTTLQREDADASRNPYKRFINEKNL
jgi:hypothetical protein